ncbi:hypothetical protein EI545_12200 [Tabrizicola piscis]|uniref:Alkaline proteinase inhibitor/ Outer membrane lipoprotein Omp19 domain-containing protein n=1 Tax=Tabrizicola piscis TaxID=2494374 RepID=A0A3S8U7H9_9RHOB|nr:hypothetical protein [Tabrizicola piscis]AZL59527.1 hypothetical protein EI545_12200 [Tabrizicola piscis]
MKTIRILQAVTLVVAISLPLAANAESPASTVADGKPWNLTAPNGRKMAITFFQDGKVKMKMGMMSRNMTWQPTKEGICLIGTPNGDRCMRLEPTANGFVGFNGEEQTLTLSR